MYWVNIHSANGRKSLSVTVVRVTSFTIPVCILYKVFQNTDSCIVVRGTATNK